MHKMSFDIGKTAPLPERKSGILSVVLLIATAIVMAWSLEPLLSALLR